MKKMTLVVISIVFLMTSPVLGQGTGAPIELKMAHSFAPEGTINDVMKVGAGWIEKRFPGRVKVTIYPAGVLVSGPASFESVIKGVCDIAIIIPGWTRGRFPKTEVIDLAPNISTSREATRAYWDFFKNSLKDEWKEVKVVGFLVQMAQSLHSRKKRIRTLDDLKGEKIRTYGVGRDMVTALGGTPVILPVSEAYEAIRTGIADGIMTSFTEVKALRFIEVTSYHTDISVLCTPLPIIMNLNRYNSLPPDIKKAFDEELTPYWNIEATKVADRYEEEGKELARKTSGHEIIALSLEEKAQWREGAMKINEAWASALEARGLPGKKLLEEKYRIIQKYIK